MSDRGLESGSKFSLSKLLKAWRRTPTEVTLPQPSIILPEQLDTEIISPEPSVMLPEPLDSELSGVHHKRPNGEYTRILTTYDVRWDKEKTARDVWQNFFDANGHTLDGINSSTAHNSDGSATLSINGLAEYDYQHLLHLGGSTKTGDVQSAGGFGEGAKIAPLILLRDFGAREVIYESKDWKVAFYLDTVKDYGDEENAVQGLYYQVEKVPYQKGSRFSVILPDQETAKLFADSKDLFYHRENPDFQNPDYENSIGGFRIHVGEKGNIYEAGQRRQYNPYDKEKSSYNNIDDITLWIKQKAFEADRDRSGVDRSAVERRVIDVLVKSMDEENIKRIIMDNPELWHKASSLGIGSALLDNLCREYSSNRDRKPFEFPDQYVALDLGALSFKAEMEKAGYIFCNGSLSRVGMITASERFLKMQEHKKLEPTENEQRKIGLLQDFVRQILEGEVPQVWIFSKEDEKSIVHGQYTKEFVWMSQESLSGEFADAIETYIHEISHGSGNGHDTKFAYTLDANVKKALEYILKVLKDPAFKEIIGNYLSAWDEAKEEQT